MENFVSQYFSLKHEWKSLVNKTSQEQIKIFINHILFNQHINSFEVIEWGDLTDFAGIQEKLISVQSSFIQEANSNLDTIIPLFEDIFYRLKALLTSEDLDITFISIPPEASAQKLKFIIDSFEKELQLRKLVIHKLQSYQYLHSSHEVLVTIAATWSSMLYTNDLALSSVEQFLGFELSALKLQKITKK